MLMPTTCLVHSEIALFVYPGMPKICSQFAHSYDAMSKLYFIFSRLCLLRFGLSAFDTHCNQIRLAFTPRHICDAPWPYLIFTPICPMVVFFYQSWSLIVGSIVAVHFWAVRSLIFFCAAAFLNANAWYYVHFLYKVSFAIFSFVVWCLDICYVCVIDSEKMLLLVILCSISNFRIT